MVRELDDDTRCLEVLNVEHYTGGEKCQYKCECMAEFVVVALTTEGRVTFVGCRECLNNARIRPIENGWVDERTDKVRHS